MLLTCSAIYFLIVIGALQSFRDGDDVTETGNSYYTCVEKWEGDGKKSPAN